MKKNCLIIVLFSFAALFACNRDVSLEGKPVNMYGGASRDNSYEQFGTFYSYTTYIDNLKTTDSSGIIAPFLPLSSQHIVAATSGGSIILLNAENQVWSAKLDSGEVAAAGMCADPQQNIYIIGSNGYLYSFSKDGKLRWKNLFIDEKEKYTIYSDLLVQEDGVIAAASNGLIRKYSFDGKIKWSNKYNLSITQTFAGDEAGNLAIPLTADNFNFTDTLLYLKPDGSLIWKKPIANTRLIKTPALYKDKIIIPGLYEINGNRISAIFALDNKGNILWKKELSVVPRFISIDNEGRIYVVGYNSGIGEAVSGVFCFDMEGKMLWKQYVNSAVPAPMLISKNILALLAVKQGEMGMYFFTKEGVLDKVVSLSNIAPLLLRPAIRPDGVIIFGGLEKLFMARIDDTPYNKLLPF